MNCRHTIKHASRRHHTTRPWRPPLAPCSTLLLGEHALHGSRGNLPRATLRPPPSMLSNVTERGGRVRHSPHIRPHPTLMHQPHLSVRLAAPPPGNLRYEYTVLMLLLVPPQHACLQASVHRAPWVGCVKAGRGRLRRSRSTFSPSHPSPECRTHAAALWTPLTA